MKNRIQKIIVVAVLVVTAFFVGRYTGNDLNTETGYNRACEFVGKITDWNTNGEELSILAGNYEFYAYK